MQHHSVNVNTYGWRQSDHIKRLLMYQENVAQGYDRFNQDLLSRVSLE